MILNLKGKCRTQPSTWCVCPFGTETETVHQHSFCQTAALGCHFIGWHPLIKLPLTAIRSSVSPLQRPSRPVNLQIHPSRGINSCAAPVPHLVSPQQRDTVSFWHADLLPVRTRPVADDPPCRPPGSTPPWRHQCGAAHHKFTPIDPMRCGRSGFVTRRASPSSRHLPPNCTPSFGPSNHLAGPQSNCEPGCWGKICGSTQVYRNERASHGPPSRERGSSQPRIRACCSWSSCEHRRRIGNSFPAGTPQ
jgi:hypothetical protein